jgi:hypothetical protein
MTLFVLNFESSGEQAIRKLRANKKLFRESQSL